MSMGADRRAPRPARSSGTSSGSSRSSCCARPRRSTCGSRLRRGSAPRAGAGVAEAHARVRASVSRAGRRPRARAGPRGRDRARARPAGRPVSGLRAGGPAFGRRLRRMAIRIVDVTDAPRSRCSRRARIPGSTIARATTGRTPTAGRRPPALSWLRCPAPPRPSAAHARPAQPVRSPTRGAASPASNPFAPAPTAARSTRSSTVRDDDDGRSTTRSRRGPRPGRRVGRRRAAQAPAARPRSRRVRELREGPARRRRARGLRPVRAAVGVPAGAADARAVPAAARLAAARGDHLHRHDARGARRAGSHASSRGGLRRPRRARVRGRRDVSGARCAARRDERRDARLLASAAGSRSPSHDERFPVMRREL